MTGDLYISGNPPSTSFVTSVDRTFTLPEAAVAESGRVKWARLYVSSYCGHMQDAKYITYTTKADWNNDGTWDNTWTETDEGQPFIYLQGGDYGDGGNDNSEFAGHSTEEPYLMLNDHTNRVTSDYLSWYDVTNLIQAGEETIKVKVDATGSYDGRIKIVELVVAYDDDSTTQTTYWVNEGHDACSYYTEDNLDEVAFGTTTFDTTGLSDITSATLIADYMASNNGYYGFPTAENDFVASEKTGSFTNIGLDREKPEVQGDYSGIDSWDVTSSVSSSNDVTFAYARYLPATGLGQFYKIPLAFLVVKKPLQSTPTPNAEFIANPTIGETPLNVSFTDLSTGAPTSWTWSFGDGSTSNEQNPIYAYSTAGTYDINLTVSNAGGSDSEVKTNYITATVAPTNDLTISGLVNTVPASAVFAREANTVKVMNVKNTGTATLTNISLSVYASDVSNGTVPVNMTTIASLVGGKTTTVTLIDPTIRNLEGGTVTYTAVVDPDNLISETDETNNNKISAAKALRYNGYKGKGIYWEGGSNITTKHTYDLQGNLLYSTQPDSAYKAVGWTDRTETWTADDLPIPSGSTIEQAFLYFAYNWDQTPGGYPWLNLNFNGNTLENGNISTGSGTIYRDWSNFGGYADYEYGLCVYDVTDKFSSAGNSLITTSVGSNVNALYPSTLVLIYRNPNETRKQIFINEECDELGLSTSSYGTTLEEATAYSPFTGMSIDVSQVTNAMLYSFAGSAGPEEGNLLFNGNTVATQAWEGSSKSGSPLVFNATNYISETGNEAGIQGTTSGGMDALQQILVVEYPEAVPVADFSANVTKGDAPLEVKFTDASTGTISSYSWDFNNDGSIDSYEQNPSHTYASAGTYTVNLTVTGPGSSDSEVKTGYITVSEPLPETPVAAFKATPTSGDAPLTVNFTDASTGTVSSYAWDFNNDGILDSYEQSPSHTYETAGTYNVNFTVAGLGGSDSEVKEGYILVSEPLPAAPVANFTANVTSGNAPLEVQFTDASNGIVSSYAWDFDNDGNVDSTEQTSSFTYKTAGTYSVNLTVTNAGGSDSEVKDGYIIVSEPLPAPPVAGFTATPTSGDVPLTVNFTDQSTGTPTEWFWDFGDGTSANEKDTSHTYMSAGIYTVNFTVTNKGGSNSSRLVDWITVTESSTPAEQPDVIVSAITLNANEVFANEENNISAKVENIGTGSAESFAVMFTVNGIDTNVTVDGLEAGANATFTITDPTIRAFGDNVTITVSADPGNEIAESSETNNRMNITKTVVYNGYKGKRYTDGNDLETQAAFEGKYELVYSAGNAEYTAANWAAKTYAWSSTDLPIPAGATVESARLYQSYTWNKMANDPAFTMSFNNNTVTPIATYKDRKGYGTFDYPCGLYVYDVTSLFDPAGNSITVTPETGNNYGIYGAYLVVVYNDPNATEKKIWINDEFDLLTSKNSYAVNNEEATAYATFSDINTKGISKATSIAILSSGSDDGKSKFIFNDNEFTGFWTDYQPKPQIGFSSYNVTGAIRNGTDTARIQSYDTGTGGDVISAMNAILVVEYVGTQNETEVPVAAFNATPTSGDSPLTVSFIDQSTGTPTSWAWDFENDGTIDSTEQNHTHIYQTAGTYTVNLTVTNEAGSNSTVKTDHIIVSESSTPTQHEPVAAFTADVTSGTAPLMVNFTDQSTNSPTSWLWNFGDGTTSNNQTVSHTYKVAGTYTVNLTVANSVGSDSEARTDYIVVSTQEIPDTTKPVIGSVVLFPANTTAGSTITFSAAITDNVEVTEVTAGEIQLTKTDGIWQGSITAPSSLGDYSLKITAKDAAGNIAETSVPYRVVQLQGGANIAVSPRASSVAAGNTVSLSIKVKNTQNIDDTFKVHISVSELPASYQANLSWFSWAEKVVTLRAGEEILVPMEVTVPDGTVAGRKLFRANVNSEKSSITGFDTGYLVIS